jgi:hypothetical protein
MCDSRSGTDSEGLGRLCFSRDGAVGGLVLATILRDLDGRKEGRRGDGNDLAPSAIARPGDARIDEGIDEGYSCSTNEGSVIVDMSSDAFEPPSRVLPRRGTFLTTDGGEFRGEGQGSVISDVLKVGV